jgi:probable rRNA maturation factor
LLGLNRARNQESKDLFRNPVPNSLRGHFGIKNQKLNPPPIVNFHTADIQFLLKEKLRIKKWLKEIALAEGNSIEQLDYVFCTDDYLHQMNVKFLDHDTLTDVITFPFQDRPIQGEIYISIDRVRDNANDLKVSFDQELSRVLAHGLLHLLGYLDETDEQEAEMRSKEDFYLQKKV